MLKDIYSISLLTAFLALSSFTQILGQSGNMYITHAAPNINVSNVNFEILQDSRGILNIANKNGILQYDASTWNLVETSGSILTLVQFEEIIYAAGRSGFAA